MHTYGFGQTHCRDLLKRIQTKFILYFYKFYMNCYEFWKFKGISKIFKRIKVFGKSKNLETVLGRFWPTTLVCQGRRPVARGRPQGLVGRCAVAWPLAESGLCGSCPRRRDARTTCGHRVHGLHGGGLSMARYPREAPDATRGDAGQGGCGEGRVEDGRRRILTAVFENRIVHDVLYP
jgi:hypothetical protein